MQWPFVCVGVGAFFTFFVWKQSYSTAHRTVVGYWHCTSARALQWKLLQSERYRGMANSSNTGRQVEESWSCMCAFLKDLSLVNLFSWHFSSSKLWIYSHVTNWQITTQQCRCRVYVQQMLRPFRSFNFFIDGWWRAACWKTRRCVVVWKLGDSWCTCGFEAGIFLTQVSIWLFDTYIFQIPFHPIRLL